MAKSFWMIDQKGNFSNGGDDTFDESKDYIGIRLQQGVPLLDRDWNELEDIRRHQDKVLRDKYLGKGTPDDGFAISLISGKVDDFNISKGRCLVDGFEAVNREDTSYSKQTDVPPLTIPTAKRTDLVYIDLWISEIHGTDDLKNDQDVKIETAARHKVEWRVMVSEDANKPQPKPSHHVYTIASIERNGATITAINDQRTALRINPLFKSLSVNNAGSIGIGTSDPKRVLHVEGTEIHSGNANSGYSGFSFANRDGPNNGAFVENGVDGQRWVWYANGQAARLWAAGDKLVVDKNGNVIIRHGTQKGAKAADNVGLKLNSADGGGVIYGFNLDHSIFFRMGHDGASNVTDYHQYGTHRFFAGGVLENQPERMRITQAGRVGIGTTDPQRMLHVEGSEIHSGCVKGENNAGFSFANRDAPNNGAYLESGADGQRWVWYARGQVARLWAAGDKLAVDKNGNVGIGTVSPVAKLQLSGDLIIEKMSTGAKKTLPGGAAMIWNDGDWLRIGQNLDYSVTSKVHVPGLFAPVSLNVGGAENWKDPGAGNAIFTGNLGTHGYSPTARHSGWGGGIHTWDIEAEGAVWTAKSYLQPNQDIAENYVSDLKLDPGDVVCVQADDNKIALSQISNDPKVIGVVSTNPGLLLNSDMDLLGTDQSLNPIALSGRVPCKVTDEGGSIKRGDLLTSSSTTGHAMKAKPIRVGDQEIFRQGTIIGKALEPLESGKGLIEIFVFMM